MSSTPLPHCLEDVIYLQLRAWQEGKGGQGGLLGQVAIDLSPEGTQDKNWWRQSCLGILERVAGAVAVTCNLGGGFNVFVSPSVMKEDEGVCAWVYYEL